jgi:MazG family protein
VSGHFKQEACEVSPRKLSGGKQAGKSKRRRREAARTGGGAQTPVAAAAGAGRTVRRAGKLFENLVALQARLLAPGGCPWDREQTHDTLRPYLIEEAYEVLDALDSGDANHIAEELGDLLLQVVFHAQLGALAGSFDISDVIEHIHTKMVRRHPHVFGKVQADTAAQVLKNWEQLKAEERRAGKGAGKGEPAQPSVLDGVPRSLPGLLEGHQLSRRAANLGFDWREAGGILDKLAEEAGELRRVLGSKDRALLEDEVGDLLFTCVNLARFLKLDAEIALKKANRKFATRFREMERLARQRKMQVGQLSAEQWESLWREVKTQARS